MSKAFTSEDVPSALPDVRLRPRGDGSPRYVTKEGHAALEAQLQILQAARAAAAAQGTIGAAQVADLDDQLKALTATLAEVTVVEPDPSQQGRAFFGAWVTLEDQDGQTARYRIVGADEADAKAGLVSSASPLGRALLGKEEGDTVRVDRPRGAAEYLVVSVDYGK